MLVGCPVGSRRVVGTDVGCRDGWLLGSPLGPSVGNADGFTLGIELGPGTGILVGPLVGCPVGPAAGHVVGTPVGGAVGTEDGGVGADNVMLCSAASGIGSWGVYILKDTIPLAQSTDMAP